MKKIIYLLFATLLLGCSKTEEVYKTFNIEFEKELPDKVQLNTASRDSAFVVDHIKVKSINPKDVLFTEGRTKEKVDIPFYLSHPDSDYYVLRISIRNEKKTMKKSLTTFRIVTKENKLYYTTRYLEIKEDTLYITKN